MPQAIFKGWVDRVVRPEVAYRFEEGDTGEGVPVGLLNAKAAIVSKTSNTPEYREREMFGDPLENLWKTCIFDLCGVKEFHRKNFSVEVTSTEEERKGWLDGGGRNCRPSIPGRQLGRRTQHAERGR